MNIICFGDSITEAAEVAPTDRWPTVLQSQLDEWKSDGFKVHNLGIGGHTSAQGFDRLDEDLLPVLPGLVLIQFGFNDANVRDWAVVPRVGIDEFKKNLCEFHRIIIACQGRSVFIINHTIGAVPGEQGNGQSYKDNVEPYNIAIGQIAEELQTSCIDLPSMMTQRQVDLGTFLTEDQIHLSADGNRVYADMVFDDLVIALRI
ncbi:MAG: GDSL-type esterase/lipase family protein [Gammaproteobacteria bacterium]|nr:GDSL-type esterase/lipase family protein [Gammaproteobacteria bacterium]